MRYACYTNQVEIWRIEITRTDRKEEQWLGGLCGCVVQDIDPCMREDIYIYIEREREKERGRER